MKLVHVTHIIVSSAMVISLSSCAQMNTKQGQGTAIGAGVGAGLGAAMGQAIGRDTEATLLGAGVGALLGGVAGNQIGYYMDSQEQELRNVVSQSEATSIRRDQDVLIATFRSEMFFDYNSSILKPGGYKEISRVAAVLNKYPQTHLDVGGHTDARGSEEYNYKLSVRRAEAVKNALIQHGVSPSRIRATGHGENQPISSSHAMNRRVEITITPITRG